MNNAWMIYGANGYTGKLIAEEAVKRGLRPILAGRNKSEISKLASELGLDFLVFTLEDLKAYPEKYLSNINLVLLCAGPFSKTSKIFVEACLKEKKHYLDITGEIETLENTLSQHSEARQKGCTLVSGVGFDVVPSDFLARALYEKLPTATHLELAFWGSSSISAGTLKTMIENIPSGGCVRQNGKFVRVPMFHKSRVISFENKNIKVSSIPWGDVATAFHTTAIPNITVYCAAPSSLASSKWTHTIIQNLFKLKSVQNISKRLVDKFVHGPSRKIRDKEKMFLWGEASHVENGKTLKTVTAGLTVAEGYRCTVLTALESVDLVLKGLAPTGALTPSQAFQNGMAFIKNEIRIH